MSSDIELLLKKTANGLHAVRIARERYAAQLSPQFNCFDYILPDEMGLSRIIRDLLDPNGVHAQGASFLKAFLKLIGKEHWADNEPIFVGIEVPTRHIDRQSRRLDIEIRWNDRALVIENKPWAIDQMDQLKDYIAELENRSLTEWHLLYLAGNHDSPDRSSLDESERDKWLEDGHLSLQRYDELIVNWLNDCVGICLSERFRWFLGEFRKFVLAQFKGEKDMQEKQAVIKSILESDISLEAALEIDDAMLDVRYRLLEQFRTQMESALTKENSERATSWHLEWKLNYWSRHSSFNIFYFPRSDQSHQLSFGFESTQCDNFYVGFERIAEDCAAISSDNRGKLDAALRDNAIILQTKGISDDWPSRGYFPDEYRFWSRNTIPWLNINNKSLGTKLVDLAAAIYDGLESQDAVTLLKR